ncbi:hypothetical protein [Paenibacillus abyssi]|uniref:Uncharacterized protein n=1 Tax=Paenibacillus abyssi TaxID=1340531 RepID=A0A917G2B2_9BACL|nr:hypothetical protein [Paenibacillus abyssi]GGG18446.1 hypothetical protein GCM10010916_39100 [Paenibacillus abyssi]
MNYFDVKAREWEKHFFKRISSEVVCNTGTGKMNMIEKVTAKFVYFRSSKNSTTHRMGRDKLRAAIAFMLYRRTTMRKQLEKFHRFNSFLMGLLRMVFSQISKIRRTAKGLRLSLRGCRFIPAGMDRDPRAIAMSKEQGIHVILASYFHLRDDLYENFRSYCRKYGVKILLDSGAWSLHSAQDQGKRVDPIRVRDLIRFVKRHRDYLYGWINLDSINNPLLTRIHQTVMERAGVTPIPVWHAQSPMEELQRIMDRYEAEVDFICIGGLAKMPDDERIKILDQVFALYPNSNFHLLGVTSINVVFRYWDKVFSLDSTFPIWSRRKRLVLTEEGQTSADKVNPSWDGEDCMAYNFDFLSRLEESYDGLEIQVPLLPKYAKIHRQLAMF